MTNRDLTAPQRRLHWCRMPTTPAGKGATIAFAALLEGAILTTHTHPDASMIVIAVATVAYVAYAALARRF